MKGYRIAFIRHGMTQANLDGRYIGTTDLPLCREGADQLYEKIEKYDYPSVQKGLHLAFKKVQTDYIYTPA